MKKRMPVAPLFFLAITGLAIPFVACAQPKVVAYVPNWVDLKSFSETIAYSNLTHINIAFENPTNAVGDFSFDPENKFLMTKARTNGVKILVSIGGGAASVDLKLRERYFDLTSDSKRTEFVRKLADYVSDHEFDGVDVDLEGPAIGKDYGAFIEDLARALKPRNKLLTAALSQGYGGKKVPDAVFEHLDFVNIMAYDGVGSWNPKSPGQHSSLVFATNNVAHWLGRGLPRGKAVLGVPFYGYGFGDAFRKRGYPYSEIVTNYPGAENFDQIGSTIWYNGIPTIAAKTRYVMESGLGGIMIWSLDQDSTGERSLLAAIHRTLTSSPMVETNETLEPEFNVIAFHTGKEDPAHISFVREANQWFLKMAAQHHFTYTATTNWDELNAERLSQCQVVLFLDTRPEKSEQRAAFQKYMENGGAWMGFHFAAFALTPSGVPQNWDWFHNQFLGSGEYRSNTWRPTSAILKVENREHPATRNLPETFSSAPNEWYRWKNDLRTNADIQVLLSIDPGSFPLGTGPKTNEVWHTGDYPVVWTNRRFKMLYVNMGHNDMDYEHRFDDTNRTLSFTFDNEVQNRLILDGLLWLGGRNDL